jgi:hypothetical protein
MWELDLATEVYANNNEVSCKGGDNKVIAAMPDVCLSPPAPPAGPVPIPYPDTSFSRDMKAGSKSVQIQGKEVMLKDRSFYKTSPLGDEAATRSFGANIVTHVITGKTYCISWSMDVKIEGENVDRHLDLTTSNHASGATTTAPMMTAAKMNAPKNHAGLGKGTPDPTLCKGSHSWECDRYSCPNCWPVPCVPNAAQEEKEYKASQSGSVKDRVQSKHNDTNGRNQRAQQRQQAKGEPVAGDPGARMESAAVQKALNSGERVERVEYWAHCAVCHFQQEVDLVTDAAVKEVKASAGGFTLDQAKRVQQIRDQCFPDKKFVLATSHSELSALERLLTNREWIKELGAGGVVAEDP